MFSATRKVIFIFKKIKFYKFKQNVKARKNNINSNIKVLFIILNL